MMDSKILLSCEQEQLHLSGAIQPHGALLALDAAGVVTHASANIGSYLSQSPEQLLGTRWSLAPLAELETLGSAAGEQVRLHGLALPSLPERRLDLVATRSGSGGVVIEFTPSVAFLRIPNPWFSSTDPQALLRVLHQVLPYDRMLYYQFRVDGDGEVIAEHRTADAMGSYLGLRFPASDIPQIARQLYVKNPWRLIPDARLSSTPVFGSSATPPDLTWSDLRSVSPVHCAYLANMGVVGSLSLPIIFNGQLDALIACHQGAPLQVANGALEWARKVVNSFQVTLQGERADTVMRLVDSANWRWRTLVEALRAEQLPTNWSEVAGLLCETFEADYVALVRNEELVAPRELSPELMGQVQEWAKRQSTGLPSTDCLVQEGISANACPVCGVLCVAIGRPCARTWLFLFRREHIHEVAWGGSPNKPAEPKDGVIQLSPRQSFERWVETRRNHSKPWTREKVLLGLQLRVQLQAPPV